MVALYYAIPFYNLISNLTSIIYIFYITILCYYEVSKQLIKTVSFMFPLKTILGSER